MFLTIRETVLSPYLLIKINLSPFPQEKTAASGFTLNEKKTNGPSDSIIAFNIHLFHMNLKITDERLNEFKSTLQETDNPHVINGILNYVGTVNLGQAKELSSTIERIVL